ncbi:glycosyltransferase [Ferrimonas balearica]|uniref:glycosyltransferase n=1 Tax=Ferrimonas balearica TaxID=44012 RepID=UPI001C96F0C2|nr:glycosyltransferase [Ferrimonas balearica]MBY5981232.1 glycosyltransferase [Ferrimonas balearica]
MQFLQHYLNKEISDTLPSPEALLAQLVTQLKSNPKPEEAMAMLEEYGRHLEGLSHSELFAISLLSLAERTRRTECFDLWHQAFVRYPANTMACRMAMRWFNRRKDLESGLQMLLQVTPLRGKDKKETELAVLGLSELKLFNEIDSLMTQFLDEHPREQALRNRYILTLAQQERYEDALAVAADLPEKSKFSEAMQARLEEILEKSKLPRKNLPLRADALGELVATFQNRTVVERQMPQQGGAPLKVCFFTGQLGSGGAERQLSRIAAEMNSTSGSDRLIEPYVCVRHAKPELKSDFFAPVLEQAGVEVIQLNDMPEPDTHALIQDELLRTYLLETHQGLREPILNLAQVLKRNKTDILYVWQDGAVIIGVVAALLAGVPKVICNFRGMAPCHRPELMRAEMPAIYRAMIDVPGVAFSANSRIAANSYAEWLGFSIDRFTIIPNAVNDFTQLPLPKAAEDDRSTWDQIVTRSPECDRTIVGIFRYDDNKRPLYWVEVAAEYARRNPNARFVIVGRGKLQQATEERIRELGAENRVFVAGVSQAVPFWLEKADLLMHLAQMEGLPNVVIEAQIAGTPVLSTPAGGVPEIVEHDLTGHVLSDAFDPSMEEILEALSSLLNDEARLSRMAERARQRSCEHHNPNKILARTQQLFLS